MLIVTVDDHIVAVAGTRNRRAVVARDAREVVIAWFARRQARKLEYLFCRR
jgi:hypothetical protein